MKSKRSTQACVTCGEYCGYYRFNGAQWCNGCGHRQGEVKPITHAPTTAPEIQARRIREAA